MFEKEMKRLKQLLILFGIINFWMFVYWQENICQNFEFEIKWNEKVVINNTIKYENKEINENNIFINEKGKTINRIITDPVWQKTYISDKEYLEYSFNKKGNYKFESSIKIGECKYTSVSKIVKTYDNMVLYIWIDKDEFKLWFAENFEKDDTIFQKIIINEKSNLSNEETFSILIDQIEVLQQAETIIVNNKSSESIIQTYINLKKANTLLSQNKELIIVNKSNKNFLKRSLAQYMKDLENMDIYIVDWVNFLQYLSNLSLNKKENNADFISHFSVQLKDWPKYLIVSYFIDKIIQNWFPIWLISIILTLSLSVLVVSIFRQVIWFYIFGSYTPLLFWIAMTVLGIKLSIGLLIIALLATSITRLFTKKIYLLHSAKTAFLLTVYFLLTFTTISLDKILWTNILDIQIFNNTFSIFWILFIIIIADKIFHEWFKLRNKTRIVSFIEFTIVSSSVFFIINSSSIKQIFLSYPELIIAVLILIIATWRFTGLQLLEYFRFMPLLKESSDWEEE